MSSESQPAADAIWVKPHFNSRGGWVRGHWRTPPRVVHVRGHFRGLTYVKPFKRRRPALPIEVPVILAGQPLSCDHTFINILRDVEPLMGY